MIAWALSQSSPAEAATYIIIPYSHSTAFCIILCSENVEELGESLKSRRQKRSWTYSCKLHMFPNTGKCTLGYATRSKPGNAHNQCKRLSRTFLETPTHRSFCSPLSDVQGWCDQRSISNAGLFFEPLLDTFHFSLSSWISFIGHGYLNKVNNSEPPQVYPS